MTRPAAGRAAPTRGAALPFAICRHAVVPAETMVSRAAILDIQEAVKVAAPPGEVEKTGVTLHVSTYRHDPRRASSSVNVATGVVLRQGC